MKNKNSIMKEMLFFTSVYLSMHTSYAGIYIVYINFKNVKTLKEFFHNYRNRIFDIQTIISLQPNKM